MKKNELLKILAKYPDDAEILVESDDGGFDSPVVYVTAVDGRAADELMKHYRSEYRQGFDRGGFGAVVLGTSNGFQRLS